VAIAAVMMRGAAKWSVIEPSPVTMRNATKRSMFEPSPAMPPAKQPVFEPSPVVDNRNAFYNDDFCCYGMGDEDDFDDCSYDGDDLGNYDCDYIMEGIEVDPSFCYGIWEDIENAFPDGGLCSRSDLYTNGTSLKSRDHGKSYANEHKSKQLAKKKTKLDKKEAERGLKMKENCKGDLWLVPDYVHNDDTSNGYDPNNMVADEKMWEEIQERLQHEVRSG
jgi:hypothetical protein